MSLEVGRVGVRPDQLDNYGRINPKSQFIQNLLNDLPAWTDLPVWKKGTEQLLPVNDDEPDTSPILCDIEYPVADLKNNQYFTYRQSPTQKDGKAKIRGIRGRTLVWNQLNTSTGTSKTDKGVTFTNLENGFFTIVGTATDDVYFDFKTERIDYKAGHKYAILGITKGTYDTYYFRIFGSNYNGSYIANVETDDFWTPRIYIKSGATINLKVAPAVYDLTLMFGTGKEPSTLEEFIDLFPLPYYKADTGSLLDFTGTKVKTVGFNQWDEVWELGRLIFDYTDPHWGENADSTTAIRSKNYISVFPKTNYYCYTGATGDINAVFYDADKKPLMYGDKGYYTIKNKSFITPENTHYIRFYQVSRTTYTNDICINISDTSKNGTYESYVSNETDLPISTFFPTGMKSAGAVYDELTPTRAITRVGSFTFDGSEDWVMESQGDGAKNFYIRSTSTRPDDAKKSTYNGIVASKDFHWRSSASDLTNVVYSGQSSGLVQVRVAADFISNIDATKWKTYLTSNPITIHYELAVEDVQPTMSFGD